MPITSVRSPRAGSPESPGRPSSRQARARWSDLRVWAGVGLLAVAAVGGAAVLGRQADEVLVLQASRDLAVGSTVQDTVLVSVPRALADDYLSASQEVGGVLRWPIEAGELIPVSAVGSIAGESLRGVTVAVEPGHAPATLLPGDLVDVWVSDSSAMGAVSAPRLVLPAARVRVVTEDTGGFGGARGVELVVPESQVDDLVAAVRGGSLDLVTVPAASQQARP